jgi:putative redox protein
VSQRKSKNKSLKMNIKTTYLGDLRTQATHIKSGNQIITDAPTDNNGKGEAFSPTDLVAGSLASCMMTIMGIEAAKLEISLEGMTASTQKIMAADPRRVSAIRIEITCPNISATPDQVDYLKQKALTCPVALSLHPDIRQEVTFNF